MQVIRFPFGKDKQDDDEYEPYKGDLNSKALQSFALETLPDFAMSVDSLSIEPFLGAVPGGNDPIIPKVSCTVLLNSCYCTALTVVLEMLKQSEGIIHGWESWECKICGAC